jgi:hypothetical protein
VESGEHHRPPRPLRDRDHGEGAAGARIVSETRRGYGRACHAGAEAARECRRLLDAIT